MQEEFDEFKKLAFSNEEMAIKLLNENAELKQKAKLYDILIPDIAYSLKLMKEDNNCYLQYDDIKGALYDSIESNLDKIIEIIEEEYNSI